jgi:hypothetical protein
MTTFNTFALQGLTLNGNTVVQYKGLNIYLKPDGTPIRYEKAWFDIEKPKRILAESAEYLLQITRMKMLREGIYFIGHVEKKKNGLYDVVQWDHTYIMLEDATLKQVEDFVFKNAYFEHEIEDNCYQQIANKIPFDKNGIVFKEREEKVFGGFFYNQR